MLVEVRGVESKASHKLLELMAANMLSLCSLIASRSWLTFDLFLVQALRRALYVPLTILKSLTWIS
jgi:hypothetical protein